MTTTRRERETRAPQCPRCGSADTVRITNYGKPLAGRYQCHGCRRWFGPNNPADAGGTGDVAKFATLTAAMEYEQQTLSVGAEFLPVCALAVRGGEEPTPEYWAWLAAQFDEQSHSDTDPPPPPGARFHPGQVLTTPGVLAKIPTATVTAALVRHLAGDWGECDEHDRRANDRALAQGDDKMLSIYVYQAGATPVRFYILTEEDRSCTTICLPDER